MNEGAGLDGTPLGALAALARLTPPQREAFVNRELLGWTVARTAQSMGVGHSYVSNLLRAAETKLGHPPRRRTQNNGLCGGCGRDRADHQSTVGCRTCSQRRYDRKRKGAYKEAA